MAKDNHNPSFFAELKRRNVYRVGLAYVVFTWLALQVVDTLGPILGLPDWTPRFVLTMLAIGFPAVILFSWAYELTPEGIKREKDVDRSQSITSHTGQRLDRITIGVLLVAVALLLVDKFFITPTPDAQVAAQVATNDAAAPAASSPDEQPSIAVLPFVNMSGDTGNLYFSDGLADTMLHMLAQVDQIRVAARTSSFQFRDQAMDISKIGAQLNVDTILEGSVQQAGDKVRVTAQLIDVTNGFHLWSGNFDRDLDDIFAIQDEIANEVVAALKVSLLGEVAGTMDRDQTDNIEAYTAYLLGIDEMNVGTSEALRKGFAHLERAVELDPDYARGWATLGHAYLDLAGFGSLAQSDAIVAAEDAANRALELVPDSSDALAVLGMTSLMKNQFADAGALLERAVTQNPNDVIALTYYGQFLLSDARPEEAVAVFEQATRLDPLKEDAYLILAGQYRALNRIDEALTITDKLREISPNSPNVIGAEAFTLAQTGAYAKAIQSMRLAHELDPQDPEVPFELASMYLAIDLPDEARRWLDRAVEIDPGHPSARVGPVLLGYYLQNDDRANARLARELLEDEIPNRRGARVISLRVMLDYARDTDDYEAFFEVMDQLYPHLFDDPPTDLEKSYSGTYFAGLGLLEGRDRERGQQFLNWLEEDAAPFVEIYGADLGTAQMRMALGNRDGALAALREVADNKFNWEFNALMLKRVANFDPIRDEPVFTELLQAYAQNAAEQRQLLATMHAN